MSLHDEANWPRAQIDADYAAKNCTSPEDFARFARVAGDSLHRLADEVENTEDR